MTDEQMVLRFEAIEASLRAAMPAERQALLERIAATEPCRAGCRGFENLGGAVVTALRNAAAISDETERRDFSRALVARLARSTMTLAAGLALTPKIVERTRAWLPRLADFLEGQEQGDYWFPGDWLCKDYRFVTMMTVPCGAQVVDLDDGVGPKTALKLALRHPAAGMRAWRQPWFRPHTEGRYLDEFNDAGWQDCYREIARLLERHPQIRGMAATSWFYDPALGEISPRLDYLRRLPMDHGALLVRHGTTPFDIHSATATSASRRALHEAGNYDPVCCSILWERRDLIAWAKANPHD